MHGMLPGPVPFNIGINYVFRWPLQDRKADGTVFRAVILGM